MIIFMIILIGKYKLFLVLFVILFISLSIEYKKFEELVYEEIYETNVAVLNIYDKKDYIILKLKAKDFTFFTSINKDIKIEKFDLLNIAFISKKVSFFDYLKGFYAKTIYFDKLKRQRNFKDNLIEKINLNHQDKMIQELFQALFLAIPISSELRDICTNYGISHLVALSGFHLAVLSFIIYWILYLPYNFFHKKYFPFRNRKYDLLLISMVILFSYLVFVDFVPSLLRAFVMLVLALFLLRSNIKILSYKTLLYTFLLVITFIPSFIFSLGFWFSIIAVFYIFLYLQYFKNMNKYFSFLFFNFWIFLVFNPIVHYFFTQTSYEQLLSPFITMVFSLFYPFEIFLHLFDISIYFDDFIESFLNHNIDVFEVKTSIYFLVIYSSISFLSIYKKSFFISLNILMIFFNLYLYLIA
jgi:competence protein ComEC